MKKAQRRRSNGRPQGRKAQTEAMGLMIIVVIISLAILFAVGFIFFGGKEDPLKAFVEKKLSSDMIGAMLRTNSGCTPDTDMEDMFIDLARGGMLKCTMTTLPNYYSQYDECKLIERSEDALNCGVKIILTNTLDEWKQSYHFQVKLGNDVIFSKEGGNLGSAKSGEVTPYTLPVPGGQYMELWLCMGSKCPNI